ncbi:hypothetical protein [Burkholderia cepacia]|uniref:hypothetical protein n=1 Tax=Burkholderia cepacia TaxID=292 RepID=UPI000B19DAD2|nr:hypothetical protein [Burkholderia cepacia]
MKVNQNLPISRNTFEPAHETFSAPKFSVLTNLAERKALSSCLDSDVKYHISGIIRANEDFGIQCDESEINAIHEFRRGFCGEACDAIMNQIEKYGISQYEFSRVNENHNGETHYFIRDLKSDIIIEPTWKQIIVPHHEEQERFAFYAEALKNYPSVFVGSQIEFNELIDEVSAALEVPDSMRENLNGYWGIFANESTLETGSVNPLLIQSIAAATPESSAIVESAKTTQASEYAMVANQF